MASGSDKLVEVGAGKKSYNYKDIYGGKKYKEYFLSYPLDRLPIGEDSFLIQSVTYKPPGEGQTLGANIMKGYNNHYFMRGEDKSPGAIQYLKEGETAPVGSEQYNIAGYTSNKGKLTVALNKASKSAISDRYNIKKKDKNKGSGDQFAKDTNFYVELPIPKQIADGQSVDWEGSSMNLFTLAGMSAASAAMKDPADMAGNMSALIRSLVEEGNLDALGVEGTDELTNVIRSSLAGAAVNQFGANVSTNNVISRGTGQILNSNKELLFNGVNLRVFKFNFTFTPRSKKESERALQIIRQMKMSMAPKKGAETAGSSGGGVMLGSPDIFLLGYLQNGKDHPFLNSFKPCALTDFSVDYTGAGTYSTYGDGTPVHMKVAMTFKETNPVYLEDYENVQIGVGY